MLPDGRRVPVSVKLDPFSRKTVRMDDTLLNEEASTTVEATQGQVVAERSMYFNYMGKYPVGTPARARWPRRPPGTWPRAAPLTSSTPTYSSRTRVPRRRREDDLPEVRGPDAADRLRPCRPTRVTRWPSTRSPVWSRPSSPPAWRRASGWWSSAPCTSTTTGSRRARTQALSPRFSNEWYFAEGYTRGASTPTYCWPTRGASPADVCLSLQSDDGLKSDVYLTVGPHSRQTVTVDNIKGWEQKAFSAHVKSDVPIAAERAMYFTYNGISGGHDAFGVTGPSTSGSWPGLYGGGLRPPTC